MSVCASPNHVESLARRTSPYTEADFGPLYSLLIAGLQEYAIFLMDGDGSLLSWNPGVQRILGYEEHEWIGRNVSMIFPEEEISDGYPAQERQSAAREGHARNSQWHIRKDRSRIWAEGIVTAVQDQHGDIIAYSRVVRDSSDHLQSQRRLESSERWWKQIVETAAEGICVVRMDGIIQFANQRLADMLHCVPADLIGQSASSFLFEDDNRPAEDAVRSFLVQENQIASLRLRTFRGDELWTRCAASVVRSQSGDVEGVLAMFSDVTEQIHRQRRLQDSEERLRLLVASARDYAVVQFDPEGNVIGWDAGAEQMLGWPADEIIGKFGDFLFTTEDCAAGILSQEIEQALRTGSVGTDRWMMRRDGSRFWGTGALATVIDADGRHRGFVKIMRDLTDRKYKEESSIQKVEGEKSILADSLATTQSELRRLSVAVISAQESERRRIARELHDDIVQQLAILEIQIGDIARRITPTAPEVLEQLRSVRAQITTLSEHLRTLSHGLHSAVLEQLGLAVALRSICEQIQRKTKGRVTLAIRRVPKSIGNEVATNLYRIAQEALLNAVRHAGPSAIHIKCYATDRDLVLTVRDTGKGFDPGQKSESGGLGIVAMRERARSIGATLSIVAKPGRGTRVRVIVPLEDL